MARRTTSLPGRAAVLLAFWISAAHAHHVMDYALPATPLEGLLSGLGHPVIGIEHLLFIAGAGVAAARYERGAVLPLVFVIASVFAASVRYLGADLSIGELPIASSLVILGAMMLAAREPGQATIAVLFLAAGTLHGHVLAEAVVGAERAPLVGYITGLAVTQSLVAFGAWRAARWIAAHRPQLPLQRLAGAAVGLAGLVFAGMIAF